MLYTGGLNGNSREDDSMLFKNRSFIQGLFISYICLLIPVFLMSTLLNQGIIVKMKKDADKAIAYQLENVKDNFENRYIYYRDSSIRLSSSSELQKYKMLSDNINARKGIIKIRDSNSYDAMYVRGLDISLEKQCGRLLAKSLPGFHDDAFLGVAFVNDPLHHPMDIIKLVGT
jgi:hypothetical protein